MTAFFFHDSAYDELTPQVTLFRECVLPLVNGLFNGFNATVFAYGQTGSGKTFTMGSEVNEGILPEDQGVIPRVIQRLFQIVHINMHIFSYKFVLLTFYFIL